MYGQTMNQQGWFADIQTVVILISNRFLQVDLMALGFVWILLIFFLGIPLAVRLHSFWPGYCRPSSSGAHFQRRAFFHRALVRVSVAIVMDV